MADNDELLVNVSSVLLELQKVDRLNLSTIHLLLNLSPEPDSLTVSNLHILLNQKAHPGVDDRLSIDSARILLTTKKNFITVHGVFDTARTVDDGRIRGEVAVDTRRTLRRESPVYADTKRYTYTSQLEVSYAFDRKRAVVRDYSRRNDTTIHLCVPSNFAYDTRKKMATEDHPHFDSSRKTINSALIVTNMTADTQRILASVPTKTVVYANCKEIQMDKEYPIFFDVDISGTAQLEIATAGEDHSYTDYKPFVGQSVTCQYIKPRLVINGYVNKATMDIYVVKQEETLEVQVLKEGSEVEFEKSYHRVPAVFSSYTNDRVVIQDITQTGCTVFLKDADGNFIDGEVTLMVRGS